MRYLPFLMSLQLSAIVLAAPPLARQTPAASSSNELNNHSPFPVPPNVNHVTTTSLDVESFQTNRDITQVIIAKLPLDVKIRLYHTTKKDVIPWSEEDTAFFKGLEDLLEEDKTYMASLRDYNYYKQSETFLVSRLVQSFGVTEEDARKAVQEVNMLTSITLDPAWRAKWLLFRFESEFVSISSVRSCINRAEKELHKQNKQIVNKKLVYHHADDWAMDLKIAVYLSEGRDAIWNDFSDEMISAAKEVEFYRDFDHWKQLFLANLSSENQKTFKVLEKIQEARATIVQDAVAFDGDRRMIELLPRVFEKDPDEILKVVQQARFEVTFSNAVLHHRLPTVRKFIIAVGKGLLTVPPSDFLKLAIQMVQDKNFVMLREKYFVMLQELLKHDTVSAWLIGELVDKARFFLRLAGREIMVSFLLKHKSANQNVVQQILSDMKEDGKYPDIEGLGIDGLDGMNLDYFLRQYTKYTDAVQMMQESNFVMLEKLLKQDTVSAEFIGDLVEKARLFKGWKTDTLAKRKAMFTFLLKHKDADRDVVQETLSHMKESNNYPYPDVEGLGIDGLNERNLNFLMYAYTR